MPFGINRPNFDNLIPMMLNQIVFFPVKTFFATVCEQNLDRSINFHHLFVRPVAIFQYLFCLGQRNPLTAAMSFCIIDKISFCIIILYMITISFAKSIINCIMLTNMIKSLYK